MKILIKIPSRERGISWVKPWVNIATTKPFILISADKDDKTMPDSYPGVHIVKGESKSKIHAFNRDIDDFINDFDLLLVGSDDMVPFVMGYDRIIADFVKKNIPDMDGFVWLKDSPQDRVATLGAMTKKYYKRFGHYYYPNYKSFFCDNEQTDVALSLGRCYKMQQMVISHQHPAWGGSRKMDDLYKRQEKNWKHDQDIFNYRKKQGFK